MESSKNSTNFRNFMYSGKHALLPPKIPFPSASPVYADYVPSSVIGSKVIQKPKGGNRSTHHQRTSSENFLIEEQPSWLDDLLNEPETPVQRGGHRRSSSDSLAYVDTADISNLDYLAQGHYRLNNMMPVHSWGSQQFDYLKDAPKTASYAKANLIKQRHRAWGSPFTAAAHLSAHKSAGETATTQSSESSCAKAEADGSPPVREKQDNVEASTLDSKPPPERKDGSNPKLPSEIDTKRAKQQFAQRSRVRKLQYIAELEKKVQALQAEGSEISAELEFVNQQSLILSMENKALKQRLENLAQEQLIKYLEQGVLEKEIGRLRALYQQQQQKQQNQLQPSAGLRRSSSLDLDSQFDNLSLKHKDAKSSHDSITGALHM